MPNTKSGAFEPCPTERVVYSQDYFLRNNNFLVDETVELPRGGACAGKDTQLWYSLSESQGFTRKDIENRKQAVEICRGCDIRKKCLLYSLEYEPHGIWGGFSERQRTALRVFWKMTPKRPWVSRGTFSNPNAVKDYITEDSDIEFVQKVAHETNLAQPFAPQRAGISSSSGRRIRKRVAHRTR